MNDPPVIRDERRDHDLTRIKERLAIVEKQAETNEQLNRGMHYALFGLPEDKTNNGIVGTVAEVKTQLANANKYLLATLVTSLVAVAVRFIH